MAQRNLFIFLLIFFLLTIAPASHSQGRHLALVDFESGSAPLTSYDEEDHDPDDWEIQSQQTYNNSDYALRIWGNSWKELAIDDYPISDVTVFQSALYIDEIGELQSIAFGDSSGNVLFYCVSGTQLVLNDRWNVVYQGAFPTNEWHPYRMTIGQDWFDTWGYYPIVDRVIFVNDRDTGNNGETYFDEIYDVTEDLPQAPTVEIQQIIGDLKSTGERNAAGDDLYRVEVQFQGLVFDPDSDTFTYRWDFGDDDTSSDQNPIHSFTAAADYTFTVSLDVRDETNLFGRDTCQVTVDPAGGGDDGIYTINFTGDIFCGRNYDNPGGLIDTYGINYLFEPTLDILGKDADVTMVNAEVPFTDQGEPHPTKSVVFRTRPENITGLAYAGIDIASTGNNHIIDYGREGLVQTHELLDSMGITHGGSGVNSYFALQPCYYTHAGIRFGFLNYCNRTGREYNEQPFLDAGYEKCGLGYWNEANNLRGIETAAEVADIIVAYPHSGGEYYTEPPEALPARDGSGGFVKYLPEPVHFEPEEIDYQDERGETPEFRFRVWPGMPDRELRYHAIDNGAHAVLSMHPHVLQGFEAYNGALIAHSLGNFMFDLSYPETMSTMVLKAHFNKEGFLNWTFKPAFIDNWIPTPASGRLGREIMDRMADYSRVLNTLVGVNPHSNKGTIFLDPEVITYTPTESEATAGFVQEGDYYVSDPIPLVGNGNLSSIIDIGGVPLSECEVCWGREVLWFGRFEYDEGYHMWNLNSNWEWIDETEFQEGGHSLNLHRTSETSGNVHTLMKAHLPADSLRYTLSGWMKTENAVDASLSLRFYSSRYNWTPLATEEVCQLSGDSDWTFYSRDIYQPDVRAPSHWRYFNVRCNLDSPDAGEAHAWFDDLKVVEWLPWQAAVLPMDVPYPNNFRFVQIRVPVSAGSVTVNYEEISLVDSGLSSVDDRDPLPRSAVYFRGATPNPFNATTILRYNLAGSAQVSLEIFDLSGRLVQQLAKNERQRPGWHSVDWDASAQPTGVYFSRLSVDGENYSRKIVLMK
jgi:poly-gamma-glutamate capsule biosynthesis protein CapA/YwtB (metallophosphatase superfamily)